MPTTEDLSEPTLLLTADQAARLLQVSRRMVYLLAEQGQIPARRVGRLWRFSRAGLEAWAEESPSQSDERRNAAPRPPARPTRQSQAHSAGRRPLGDPVHLPAGPLYRPAYPPAPPPVRPHVDEAKAKWDAEAEAVGRERWRPDGSTPFLEVATAWLKTKAPDARYRQGHPVRASTYHRDYQFRIQHHAIPYLGAIPIERVTARTIDDWMTWLADNERTDDTIGRCLGRVKQVLSYARGRQLIGGEAWWDDVTGPLPAERRRRGVLRDADEAASARVLAAVRGHYLEVMFEIALMLGPRPGELRGPRAEDVDRERRLIHLHHTLDWAPGGIPVLEDAKTEAGERTIRLPNSLWARFEAYLDARETTPVWVLRRNAWIGVDLVFRRSNGRPLRGDGAGGTNDLFRRCLRRAGVPEHNAYQLRHLAVGTLLTILKPHEVAQIVGQSSYRLTLDAYTPRMREVLERTAIDLEPIYAHLRALDLARETAKESDKESGPRRHGRFVREVA